MKDQAGADDRMKEHDVQTMNRYRELLQRALQSGIYMYTPFHSPSGASLAFNVAEESRLRLWGGAEGCERVVIRFGDPEETGYEEDFPISLLKICPRQAKYADNLDHRDFLGAILNLGLERDTVGDILIRDKEAYVFVLDTVAELIENDLERVKHTPVFVSRVDEIPEGLFDMGNEKIITVPSLRLDAIISKAFHISRSEAKALFNSEKVFINGRLCKNPESQIHEDDVISARGFGRFTYSGESHSTRKGNLAVRIIN